MAPKDEIQISYLTRNWEKYPPKGPRDKIMYTYKRLVADPIIWVHDNWVKPNQKTYYWYHRQHRRVPTIDQCYDDDTLCRFEADMQFHRDKKVDATIVSILQTRFENCHFFEAPVGVEKCEPIGKIAAEARTNYFIKYGELGTGDNAYRAFMKQKNRMLWERRHGPVGSGRKMKHYRADGTAYYE